MGKFDSFWYNNFTCNCGFIFSNRTYFKKEVNNQERVILYLRNAHCIWCFFFQKVCCPTLSLDHKFENDEEYEYDEVGYCHNDQDRVDLEHKCPTPQECTLGSKCGIKGRA